MACSSSQHELGESAAGAAGKGSSAGETAVGGAPVVTETPGSSGSSNGGKVNVAGDGGVGGEVAIGDPANFAGSSTGGSSSGSSGTGGAEALCTQSGGMVMTALCCGSASDFPNECLSGACGCAPAGGHEIKVCSCTEGDCFDGQRCTQSVPGPPGAGGASGNGG